MNLLFLVVVGFSCLGVASQPNDDVQKAIAAIERAKGVLEFDQKTKSKVVWVSFSRSKLLRDDDLAGFKALTHLRHLNLDNTRIGDRGLSYLGQQTALEELSLWKVPLSDEGLASLKNLRKLRDLDLTFTKAGDSGIKAMSGAKDLRRLSLHGTQISDESLLIIKGFENLEFLDLGDTKIGDEGLKHVKTLRKLKWLHIDHAKITDAGLGAAQLNKHHQLICLNLTATNITDKGMKELKGLQNLETLSVTGTKVTVDGLSSIVGSLPKLSLVEARQLSDGDIMHLKKLNPNAEYSPRK